MKQIRLSKSRYTRGVQCPKMLWMERNMPERFDDSVINEAALEGGSLVGDLAKSYYGDFVEVPLDLADFQGMAARTAELVRDGSPTICEATFAKGSDLCMVDILRVEGDGVHIVEVKSTAHVKDVHKHDMAYQAWLVGKCGLNVKSVSLMHLDRNYVRQGNIDLHGLFTVVDCTDGVLRMAADVPAKARAMRAIASQKYYSGCLRRPRQHPRPHRAQARIARGGAFHPPLHTQDSWLAHDDAITDEEGKGGTLALARRAENPLGKVFVYYRVGE